MGINVMQKGFGEDGEGEQVYVVVYFIVIYRFCFVLFFRGVREIGFFFVLFMNFDQLR